MAKLGLLLLLGLLSGIGQLLGIDAGLTDAAGIGIGRGGTRAPASAGRCGPGVRVVAAGVRVATELVAKAAEQTRAANEYGQEEGNLGHNHGLEGQQSQETEHQRNDSEQLSTNGQGEWANHFLDLGATCEGWKSGLERAADMLCSGYIPSSRARATCCVVSAGILNSRLCVLRKSVALEMAKSTRRPLRSSAFCGNSA